jgi:hypothetical protein
MDKRKNPRIILGVQGREYRAESEGQRAKSKKFDVSGLRFKVHTPGYHDAVPNGAWVCRDAEGCD